MTRDERVRVYRDTKRMCDTHPKLRSSISASIRGQRIIPETRDLPMPNAKYSEDAKKDVKDLQKKAPPLFLKEEST